MQNVTAAPLFNFPTDRSGYRGEDSRGPQFYIDTVADMQLKTILYLLRVESSY